MQLIQVALLAAVGVSAHPSIHNHRAFHAKQARQPELERREEMIYATLNGKVVSWPATAQFMNDHKPTSTAEAPAPTTTTAAPAPPAATPAAKSSESASSGQTNKAPAANSKISGFKQLTECSKNSKRATTADIFAVGNIGSNCGGTYGSNLAVVDNADGHDFSVKVTGNKDLACAYWNKIGPDGGVNGFFKANINHFEVAAGESKYIVAARDSQFGFACGIGELHYTSTGAVMDSWGEVDFISKRNKGNSGYDASAIVGHGDGHNCNPVDLFQTDGSQHSKILPGCDTVAGYNKYNPGADGIGGQVPDTQTTLHLIADYSV